MSAPTSDRPSFSVYVKGRPAPQGSKHLGEHGQVREQSPYLAPWRGVWTGKEGTKSRRYQHGAIGLAVYTEYARRSISPLTLPLFAKGVPVALGIGFYLGSSPTEPPDLDKLVRAVGDALTVCRVFADDAQVVTLNAWKYSADPEHPQGAFITVGLAEPVPVNSAGLTVRRVRRLYRTIPRG
jgi:hypothetical protein